MAFESPPARAPPDGRVGTVITEKAKRPMKTTSQLPTGQEIIAREPAYGPHPHPRQNGRLVPFTNVNRILVESTAASNDGGVELFECAIPDVECDYVHEKLQSVVSHLSSHRPDRKGPNYPEETLRLLIRLVKSAIRQGFHNYAAIAASELNRRGTPTLGGTQWTPTRVSHLYRSYQNTIKTRGPNAKITHITPSHRESITLVKQTPPAPDTSPAASTEAQTRAAISLRLAKLEEQVNDACNALARVTAGLHDLAADVANLSVEPDPELVAKAENWDRLAGPLSSVFNVVGQVA